MPHSRAPFAQRGRCASLRRRKREWYKEEGTEKGDTERGRLLKSSTHIWSRYDKRRVTACQCLLARSGRGSPWRDVLLAEGATERHIGGRCIPRRRRAERSWSLKWPILNPVDVRRPTGSPSTPPRILLSLSPSVPEPQYCHTPSLGASALSPHPPHSLVLYRPPAPSGPMAVTSFFFATRDRSLRLPRLFTPTSHGRRGGLPAQGSCATVAVLLARREEEPSAPHSWCTGNG